MSEFKGIKRVLVIKLRHIGDVLLAVPAIRAVKESFPKAEVTALVNSGTEEMLALNPAVDEVLTFDRSLKGLSLTGRVVGELKFLNIVRKKGFDMTIDLTGGDRPAFIGLTTGAKYRLGYNPEGSGFKGKKLLYTHLGKKPERGTHAVLKDLGLLRQFGIDTKNLSVDIYSTPQDDARVKTLLNKNGFSGGKLAHVHPTSRWFFKCWTDDGMAYAMDKLAGAGFTVAVTSGPEEREIKKTQAVISKMKTKPIDLSGRLRLKEMVSLSKMSSIFFGVDSAPMHIASACGIKVVALFGPSGAFDWGPWDNKAAVGLDSASPYPAKSGLQRFGQNIVIQTNWDCVPCGKDGCNGSKKSDCLDAIKPEYAWSVLENALSELSKSKSSGMLGTGLTNKPDNSSSAQEGA